MGTRRVRWAAAVLATLGLVGVPALTAHADGEAQMPLPVSLTVTGATGTDSASVPIPTGETPVAVTATVTGGTRASGPGGTYTFRAGTGQAQVDARTGGTVTVPLTADSVKDSRLEVALTAQIYQDNGCPDDTNAVASIRGATLTYVGAPTLPTSLADFFTSAMTSVTLRSAPESVTFTSPAVLQAASSLAVAYPRVPIGTTVPAGAGALDRIVQFEARAGDVTTRVDITGPVPTLILSGDPQQLVTAAAALGNANLALGGGSDVTAALSQKGVEATPLSLRWRDIGGTTARLQGIGQMELSITVPQAQFGGPVSQLDINIVGTHIPTAANATTTASLLVNDQLYSSTTLGSEDQFSLKGTVGPDRITRDSRIVVQVRAVPAGGVCQGLVVPARVDINATDSTVVATPGQSLKPGFTRFPQVLGHQLPVAFAKSVTPTSLSDGVNIVASVSRLDVQPSIVSVLPLAEFMSSTQPGLLLDAGADESAQAGAPLVFTAIRAPATVPPQLAVAVATPFGALEGFDSSGRDLLMLGSYPAGDPALAASLQSQVAQFVAPAPDGWYQLTGNVALSTGQKTPAVLDLTPAPATNSAPATSDSGSWIALVGVVVVVVAVGWIAWAIARRRKPGTTGGD